MKILFVSPLTREITPSVTAGRPRVIFDLISGLVKRGHKITLLGVRGSKINNVKVIPVIEKGFYSISSSLENPFYGHTSYLAVQAKMLQVLASNFDIIHNHAYPEYINLLVEDGLPTPMITTLHMAYSKELDYALSFFPKSKIICASTAAAKLFKKTKIFQTIHHGVDTGIYKFCKEKDDYFLWVGRLSKAKDANGDFLDPKGVKIAIKLAEETNSKLKIVANVEDIIFFEKEVKPHLSEKIKWVGPISREQPLSKKEISNLFQKAKALLMTTQLPEAFGLVSAEAQSCGTPVIGFNIGPLSEIIINGKTGFVVDSKQGINGLKIAMNKIYSIKPEACRENAAKNFSIDKMIFEYENIYSKISNKRKSG